MHIWIVGGIIAAAVFFFARSAFANAPATMSADSGNILENPSVGSDTTLDTAGTTRGERNNNPGNIRYNAANHWKGQTGSDGVFATFGDVHYGIRALCMLMRTYFNTYSLATVHDIISKYAPTAENPTANYIDNVADGMGVSPYDNIDVTDAITMQRLVTEIIRQENGRVIYAASDVAQGVSLT